MRILPGIMPVVSPERLARIIELTGESTPLDLQRRLEAAADEQSQRRIGIDHAIALGSEVIAGGASGLHLYTFNQHEPVLAVLRGAGLLDRQKEHA